MTYQISITNSTISLVERVYKSNHLICSGECEVSSLCECEKNYQQALSQAQAKAVAFKPEDTEKVKQLIRLGQIEEFNSASSFSELLDFAIKDGDMFDVPDGWIGEIVNGCSNDACPDNLNCDNCSSEIKFARLVRVPDKGEKSTAVELRFCKACNKNTLHETVKGNCLKCDEFKVEGEKPSGEPKEDKRRWPAIRAEEKLREYTADKVTIIDGKSQFHFGWRTCLAWIDEEYEGLIPKGTTDMKTERCLNALYKSLQWYNGEVAGINMIQLEGRIKGILGEGEKKEEPTNVKLERILNAVHKSLQWEDGEIAGIDMIQLEGRLSGILRITNF